MLQWNGRKKIQFLIQIKYFWGLCHRIMELLFFLNLYEKHKKPRTKRGFCYGLIVNSHQNNLRCSLESFNVFVLLHGVP